MKHVRRFLLASSFARLIKQGRAATRIVEGHFNPGGERESYVVIEANACQLVLIDRDADGKPSEERTAASRKQCEVLLDVCAGKVGYERLQIVAHGREVIVDRVLAPGLLDVVIVEFESEDQAGSFRPPAWFGPEVTDDATYTYRSIALEGIPRQSDVPIHNFGLETLLDDLDGRGARFPRRRDQPVAVALRDSQAEAAPDSGDGLFEPAVEALRAAAAGRGTGS